MIDAARILGQLQAGALDGAVEAAGLVCRRIGPTWYWSRGALDSGYALAATTDDERVNA